MPGPPRLGGRAAVLHFGRVHVKEPHLLTFFSPAFQRSDASA